MSAKLDARANEATSKYQGLQTGVSAQVQPLKSVQE